MNISQFPLVEAVKVARVHTPVRFDDALHTADACHRAGFRPSARQNSDPVVKLADVRSPVPLPVAVPQIKQGDQEIPVLLLMQPGPLRPSVSDRIQAGNVLLVHPAICHEIPVDFPDVSSGLIGHHRQNVKVAARLLKQPDSRFHT